MSLINRVLTELERRDATETVSRPLPTGVRALEEQRRRASARWLMAGVLLVVTLVALGWWLTQRQHRSATPTQLAVAPPAAQPIQPPPAAPPQPSEAVPALAPTARAPAAVQPPSTVPAAPLVGERRSNPLTPARESPQPEAAVAETPPALEQPIPDGAPEARAAAEFRRGLALFQKQQFSEAELAWRNALDLAPGNEPARRALASLLLNRGEREAAEQLLSDGFKANPTQLRVGMSLARLQLDRNAPSEALRTLESGLPYAEGNGEYLGMTATLKAGAGRQRQAAQLYESALHAAPGNAAWLIGLGLALRADGRTQDALDIFLRARELESLDAQQRALVGRQIRELGG